MSKQMKYIVLRAGEQEFAVIFDKGLAHINVADGIRRESASSKWSKVLAPLEPVSAGFIYMPEAEVDPSTGSESLGLKPRPQDQGLIRGEPRPLLVVSAADGPPARPKLSTPPPTRSLLDRARGGKGRL